MKNSSDFTLLVTQFGQPVNNVPVNVTVLQSSWSASSNPWCVAPTDAIIPTDNDGHVTFTFIVNQPIPENQSYLFDACSDYKQAQKANMHEKISLLRRAVDLQVSDLINNKSKHIA